MILVNILNFALSAHTSLIVGVSVELTISNTIIKHIIKSPSNRKTLASVSHSVLLTNAINQLLSRKSHLHNLIVLLEVQLLNSVLNRSTHSESPSHRAVLRLANVLSQSRLVSQTTSNLGSIESVNLITRIQRRHQITEIRIVVNRGSSRNRSLNTRVTLLGRRNLLELIRMPISIESELHHILVTSVPVMDLLARILEVLQTLLELSRLLITRSALHGIVPLLQILQITSLSAREIVLLVGRISGVSRLASKRLALIEVRLRVAVRDTSPALSHIVQLQEHAVDVGSIKIIVLVKSQILHIHHSRSSALNIIVSRVQTISSSISQLLNQHKSISLFRSIRKTHLTTLLTFQFRKSHRHKTFTTLRT